jgi:flagellar hook protein FlgE
MFDTIQIGTSGLLTHAAGLKVVGNNLANVNTPGFKSSQLQFAALFEQSGGGQYAPRRQNASGAGVEATMSKLNFRTGVDQATGNPLDLSIDGNGLFVVKRGDRLLYTRTGDFRFDENNVLTNSAGDKVQALDSNGKLTDVTLDGLAASKPHATQVVTVRGNLTSTVATPPVDGTLNAVSFYDTNGNIHSVNLTFKDGGAGVYAVTVTDAAAGADPTPLATGSLTFTGGFPTGGGDSVTFSYAADGAQPFSVKLDFSNNVTSLATATTLGVASQDGYAPGVLTDQSIGTDGTITVSYSNLQKGKGERLALAVFNTEDDLDEIAGGLFDAPGDAPVRYGYAQAESFGSLVPGHREGSNVDLAEEFGNLILMQRGYQASSHVISTANDMIQQLFDMKGR